MSHIKGETLQQDFTEPPSSSSSFSYLTLKDSEVNVPVAVLPVRTRRSESRFGQSGSRRGATVRPDRLHLSGGLSSVFHLLVVILRLTGFMRPCRGVDGSCRWLSTASLLVHLHRLRLVAHITPAGFTLQPDWRNILEVKSTDTQRSTSVWWRHSADDTGGSDLFCLKKSLNCNCFHAGVSGMN